MPVLGHLGTRVLAIMARSSLARSLGIGVGRWCVGVRSCWWGSAHVGLHTMHQHNWQPLCPSGHSWWLRCWSLRVLVSCALVGSLAAAWRKCHMTAPVPALVGMRAFRWSRSPCALQPLPSASYNVSVRSGLGVGRWLSPNPSNTTAGLSMAYGTFRVFVRSFVFFFIRKCVAPSRARLLGNTCPT